MKIKINQVEIAYTDRGTGKPLLLIHGYPLSRKMWDPQIEVMAAHVRVLAPDLRGFGESSSSPGPYSMEQLADDLYNFLDKLKISEPVSICGLSMGGYIVFAFAKKYPASISKIILVSTRAGSDSPEGRQGRDRAAQAAREHGIQEVVNTMAPKLLSPANKDTNPLLVETVKELMQPSLDGVLGSLIGMRDRQDFRPFLSQIKKPSLIIHGADDPLIPVSEAELMAKSIPGAQFVIIPNAGHLPNLEQPELFNKELIEFLTS